MSGDTFAWGAGLIVVGAWAAWFYLLRAVRVPENRQPFMLAMTVGGALAVIGLLLGAGLAARAVALFALLAGGAYLALRLQSAQDRNVPAVEVGGEMLDFAAIDDTGERFEFASLRGRPVLVKFFRGHW